MVIKQLPLGQAEKTTFHSFGGKFHKEEGCTIGRDDGRKLQTSNCWCVAVVVEISETLISVELNNGLPGPIMCTLSHSGPKGCFNTM